MRPIALLTLLAIIVSCEEFNFAEFGDFLSVRKRENAGEMEQCAPVNFAMGQLGVVNVVAFLDNSWAYSHKQASMLKLLKDRLQRAGLPEALFFVITSGGSPNSLERSPEEEIEREAWEGVSPDEAVELSSGLLTYEPLERTISADIFVIEDNEELGLWRELHGSRDQILVIDRCGKLAYQVIVPWSILHFPYVKAAILSTHKDDPCGSCDAYATIVELDDVSGESGTELPEEVAELTASDPEATTEPNVDDLFETNSDEDEVLPALRIIMHAPHYHLNADAKRKHEYLVLESDKPNYHGHLDVPSYEAEDAKGSEEPLLESIVFEKDESPGLYGEVADFWRDVADEEMTAGTDESTEEVETTSTTPADLMDEGVTSSAEFTVEEEESRSRLIAHYSRLLPWIYYHLDK